MLAYMDMGIGETHTPDNVGTCRVIPGSCGMTSGNLTIYTQCYLNYQHQSSLSAGFPYHQ